MMTSSQRVYEVQPRKDHRGVTLISDALPFGRLWHGEPNAIGNAIGLREGLQSVTCSGRVSYDRHNVDSPGGNVQEGR